MRNRKHVFTIDEYIVGTGKQRVMPRYVFQHIEKTRGIMRGWVDHLAVVGNRITVDYSPPPARHWWAR